MFLNGLNLRRFSHDGILDFLKTSKVIDEVYSGLSSLKLQ